MTPAFDVFRNDKSNCAIWLTAVNNLEEGEAHVRRLALDSPAEYFIFNQRTSIRYIVDARPRAARLPARATPSLLRKLALQGAYLGPPLFSR
jgi:hypothetical protein